MEDWLAAYKIPLGKWIASFVDLLNEHAAFAVQRHLGRARLPDRRPDRADAGDAALLPGRAVRRRSPTGCTARSGWSR